MGLAAVCVARVMATTPPKTNGVGLLSLGAFLLVVRYLVLRRQPHTDLDPQQERAIRMRRQAIRYLYPIMAIGLGVVGVVIVIIGR